MIGRFTRLTTTFLPASRGLALAGNSPQLIRVFVQPHRKARITTMNRGRRFQLTDKPPLRVTFGHLLWPSRYTYGVALFEAQIRSSNARRTYISSLGLAIRS